MSKAQNIVISVLVSLYALVFALSAVIELGYLS